MVGNPKTSGLFDPKVSQISPYFPLLLPPWNQELTTGPDPIVRPLRPYCTYSSLGTSLSSFCPGKGGQHHNQRTEYRHRPRLFFPRLPLPGSSFACRIQVVLTSMSQLGFIAPLTRDQCPALFLPHCQNRSSPHPLLPSLQESHAPPREISTHHLQQWVSKHTSISPGKVQP